MTTEDFITELFSTVDDTMSDVANHSQASLNPNEVVTILPRKDAMKGVGTSRPTRDLA